jgi:hypothetical protein
VLRFADSRSTAPHGRLLNCNWEGRLAGRDRFYLGIAEFLAAYIFGEPDGAVVMSA